MSKIPTYPLETDRRRSFLEKILNEPVGIIGDSYVNPSVQDEYIDGLLLNYVLGRVGIKLSDVTDRSVRYELQYWDRDHLIDLAENIDQLIQTENNKEKLKYIIEHSIQGDLTRSLSSCDPNDKFAAYNAVVLDELGKSIDIHSWLYKTNNMTFTQSLNPNNFFSLATRQWDRDFRSEYSIGNISECCIAVNSDTETRQYKPVLLDLFLDLSMQIAHIQRISPDHDDSEDIGQIYFFGSKLKEKIHSNTNKEDVGEVCLTVTSVEIADKYRRDNDLIPTIVSSLVGEDGYKDIYGFNCTLIGQRFGSFRQYVTQRKNDIANLYRTLNQKLKHAQKENSQAKKVDEAWQSDINKRISTLSNEVKTVGDLKDIMPNTTKVRISKIGLPEAVESKQAYLGTDYLDIFGEDNHDGFFRHSVHSPEANVFSFAKKGFLHRLETTYNALSTKYCKKKAKR